MAFIRQPCPPPSGSFDLSKAVLEWTVTISVRFLHIFSILEHFSEFFTYFPGLFKHFSEFFTYFPGLFKRFSEFNKSMKNRDAGIVCDNDKAELDQTRPCLMSRIHEQLNEVQTQTSNGHFFDIPSFQIIVLCN